MRKKILYGIAFSFLIILIIFVWQLDLASWTQLDMNKLKNHHQTTIIYDANGLPVAGLHSGENRTIISLSTLPDHVKNAFIAIEDARFYNHCGIDLWRIGGAFLNNIRAGGYAEGASTITQQLIKLTHLTSEKKLSRKAQEAWLALQLERIASKDEILEMYLNVVYFGKGAYGIEAAAQAYFGKQSQNLTLAESALLAGIIKAPGVYAPHISLQKSIERRKSVLEAMVREGFIDTAMSESASQEPIQLSGGNFSGTDGSWYIDWALVEASKQLNISLESVLSGGLHIYTALQTDLQQTADRIYEHSDYFPNDAKDNTRPESAFIALNPSNGEILCMIGGRNYTTRLGLNRAVQIARQPGSTLKPISVYAAAIDYLGMTPLTLLEDVARDYNGYTPSNASGKEYGQVTLRQSLSQSMNLASVDLITKTGISAAATYAKRAGIPLTTSDNNLSLALGSLTTGVSPAQLSAAYSPLVNGGYRVHPHAIRSISDSYGNILYEFSAAKEYVMSNKSARMLTSVLEDAVQNGTAQKLSDIGFPVAAKTGTAGYAGGGNRDAWTVAYTPNISVAVWMGFDRPDEEHILPEGITGGTYPARLAAAFLTDAAAWANAGAFPIPEGMSTIFIDKKALDLQKKVMLASETTPPKYLLEEILPDEQLPLLISDLWNKPHRIETLYVQPDHSGFPSVSFIAVDPYSEYRIIRRTGDIETEIGTIQGENGQYISITDETAPNSQLIEYCVVAQHSLFAEEGVLLESEPSPWITYQPPGILERIMHKNEPLSTPTIPPLFQQTHTSREKELHEANSDQ